MTRKDKIIYNLSKYCFINKFFGGIISQRLGIKGYTLGILTAQLLDSWQSDSDLKSLDNALRLAEERCRDFKYIFRERTLPIKDRAIDREIINILAEIRAIEVIYNHSFIGINKVRRTQNKTVDFTAIRNKYSYAIEVIRLGLTQSTKKEPKYLVDFSNKDISFKSIRGLDNIQIFRNIIKSAIDSKYPQIEEFCKRQEDKYKGILFISTGRDYFIANRYAQNPFNLTPRSTSAALNLEWDLAKQKSGYYYLQHVIITMGKDSSNVITYPKLQ